MVSGLRANQDAGASAACFSRVASDTGADSTLGLSTTTGGDGRSVGAGGGGEVGEPVAGGSGRAASGDRGGLAGAGSESRGKAKAGDWRPANATKADAIVNSLLIALFGMFETPLCGTVRC